MPHHQTLEYTPRSRPGSTPGCYVYSAPPVKEDDPPWDREGQSPSLGLQWPRSLVERRMPNGTYGGVRGGGCKTTRLHDAPSSVALQKSLGCGEFLTLGIAIGGQGLQLGVVITGRGEVAGGFRRAGGTGNSPEAVGVALQGSLELG